MYRKFEDAAAFREAIETLEKKPSGATAQNQLSLLAEDEASVQLPVVSQRRASGGKTGEAGKGSAQGGSAGRDTVTRRTRKTPRDT